jgi:hypothetical protein
MSTQLADYPHEGLWMGVDTYGELSELNRPRASGEAPWNVWPE